MQSNTDNCNQVTFMCKRHWSDSEARLVDRSVGYCNFSCPSTVSMASHYVSRTRLASAGMHRYVHSLLFPSEVSH